MESRAVGDNLDFLLLVKPLRFRTCYVLAAPYFEIRYVQRNVWFDQIFYLLPDRQWSCQ